MLERVHIQKIIKKVLGIDDVIADISAILKLDSLL